MPTLSTKLVLVAFILCFGSLHAAEPYDKMAHIQVLPNPPLFARNAQECERYSERMRQLVTEVETAHDGCLRAETGKTFGQVPNDSQNRCSNPVCQKLHDARDSYRKTGEDGVARCSATVAEYQRKEQGDAFAKRERRLKDAQSNPCIKDWSQYEGMCIGAAESESDAKNCSTELNRLRRSCPNSGR